MKIRTASTRRAIDRWKSRANGQAVRFRSFGTALAAKLLVSSARGKVVFVFLLVVALSLNFAVLELGIFVLIGFLVAKLNCYRFANSMMRLVALRR